MSKEMKVGIFFVIGMIILGALTLYAGGFEDWLKDRFTVHAFFNKVDGLDVEDVVTLAGVEVGKVKEMRVADSRVEVVVLIDSDARVRKDAVARIESESLLGGKYVGLSMGSVDAPLLEDGDHLATEEAADLTQMLQNVAEVAEDLRTLVGDFNENQQKISDQITGILGENRENVRTTFETLARIMSENEEGIRETVLALQEAGPELMLAMENLNKIIAKVESGEGTIGKLVQDDSVFENIKELSASLNDASGTLTRILGDNEEDLRTIIASLSEVAPKLEETMNRIDVITKKIEQGEGTVGKLVNDETLYKEATRMLKEARHAAEDVREQVPIITFTSVIFGAFQ